MIQDEAIVYYALAYAKETLRQALQDHAEHRAKENIPDADVSKYSDAYLGTKEAFDALSIAIYHGWRR
jgi:ATP-dependent protease Clp ATPase subunit